MGCRGVRDSNQGNPVILPIMVKTVTLANTVKGGLFGCLGKCPSLFWFQLTVLFYTHLQDLGGFREANL
jgi:hypothetical protein